MYKRTQTRSPRAQWYAAQYEATAVFLAMSHGFIPVKRVIAFQASQ